MIAPPRLSLTRWLSLLVFAAVVPLLLFAALTLTGLTRNYRATADRGQADTTHALALAIDAEMRAWKAVLLALAESSELRGGRLKAFYAEASAVAARHRGWIGLTDPAGRLVLSTARTFGLPLPASNIPELVERVFRDRTAAVSDMRVGRIAPVFLITVAVPVLQNNHVRYALHLSLTPDTLTRTLAAQRLPDTWIAGVVDAKYQSVARWPHLAERVGQPVIAQLQAAFASRDHGVTDSTAREGQDIRVAFTRLTEAPWVVNVSVPHSELHAAWRTPFIGFLLVGTALALLAVGLTVAVSRRIARPIQELARHSEAMRRGEVVALTRPSRIQEVHQLQEALVRGAEQAQAYYRERERSARAEEAARAAAAAEAAVRQSQVELNRAQAVARTGSWRLDGRAGELWWSDETYRIFGIPQGTPLTYASFLAAVHPEDREQVDRAWNAALEGALYDIEHRILVGGELRWVRARAEIERDPQGRLLGGFGTVQDVTDQKAAEAERRSLTLFPEQNPSPVLRIAGDGTVLYANAASRPLLAAWGCAVGGRLSPGFPYLEVLAAGHTVEHEVACEGRIYSLVCVPFEAEGYINIYGRDLTERKRAEQALADSQHLLHSVLEQAGEGITVRDAQGRVMFVNAVARRRARQRPEGTPLEVAPQVWGEYLDADGKPVPVDEWPAARALRGETVTREFLRRTPTGALYVLNSGAPLRNEKGEVIGAVTITTDISDRKRTEDQLRDALAQEEQARADNLTLLREVHHRTKNNLQMLCDMLYLEAELLEDSAGRQALEKSYTRVYAFARLHEQLHGALHGGQIEFRKYVVGVVQGFGQVYPTLSIGLDLPASPISLDVGRALHAGLILNELITNAAKYAFPGQTGEVHVSIRAAGNQLELQVRDKGIGLPPDFQLDHVKSLGLRIVHLLARRLDARVTVEGANGTAFTLAFPLEAEPSVGPQGDRPMA